MEYLEDWRRRDRGEQYRREDESLRDRDSFDEGFRRGYRRGEYGRGYEETWGRPEYRQPGQRPSEPIGWYSYSAYAVTVPRGRYTGRGPKNYQRSDERIREDVSERLEQNPDLDASEIEVKVKNREVTLEGKVEDRRAKRLAEDIAESCPGVKDVHNRLKIEQGFFTRALGKPDDEEWRLETAAAGSTETPTRPRT